MPNCASALRLASSRLFGPDDVQTTPEQNRPNDMIVIWLAENGHALEP
jgi:hypothetical protein